MKKIKFLLLGITGDLSKKKILPALAQFSEIYQNEIKIDLIGYSRSKPDQEEIEQILKSNTNSKKIFLNSIKFHQGLYSDAEFFINIFNQLQKEEKLIIYMATPPLVFFDIISIFCPLNQKDLDIIIEKPFGENLEQTKKLIEKIHSCKLDKNVHFFDHYLFKNETNPSLTVQRKLKEINSDIKEIFIRILESIDLKNRGGYYDQIGAIKDMFPSHMVSLLTISLKLLGLDYEKVLNNIEIKDVYTEQYKDYLKDLEIEKSDTETYFLIKAESEGIKFIFESGKKQKEKITDIDIKFENNDIIEWNIFPKKNLFINLQKKKLNFSLDKNNYFDHTNLFIDLLNNDDSKFLSEELVVLGWEVWEKIEK